MCKGLVEAKGGRIWEQLREGDSLVIFVMLPLEKQEQRGPMPTIYQTGQCIDHYEIIRLLSDTPRGLKPSSFCHPYVVAFLRHGGVAPTRMEGVVGEG